MDFATYSCQDPAEIADKFDVSLTNGLTARQAAEGKLKQGENRVKLNQVKWWQILGRQFKSTFVYLLFGASLIAYTLGEYFDGSMILMFVMINAALGFFQEFRSEQTAQLLKKFVAPKTLVVRSGKEVTLPSQQLLVGDVVLLRPGDMIPADLRIVEALGLTVDESVLTGESRSVVKVATTLKSPAKDVFGAVNIAFGGATVVSGTAKAMVVAIGRQTMMGDVAKLTAETTRVSSFERGVSGFSKFILQLVMVTLVVIIGAHLLIKKTTSPVQMAVFAIALAVSVIPEALPVVTTFSLSRGALRLAKNHVVVKRLSAIEDLGSIEVLCSDKTGTVTENRMRVVNEFGPHPRTAKRLGALCGYLAEDGRSPTKDSFDVALWQAIRPEEQSSFGKIAAKLSMPFDPVRRRVSYLISDGGSYEVIVRGAPEVILKKADLTDKDKSLYQKWVIEQGELGRRILAVGYKKSNANDDLTHDLTNIRLLGLLAFEDPIKPSTKLAVKNAAKLGVQIKLLTGDLPEVAGAVGYQIGLIDNPQKVMTGEEFDKLTDKQKKSAVMEYHVFARVSPQQKYAIIQTLEGQKEVGFLGEGINDAPALKVANVGLVVNGASDIARDAADIILLNRSLSVIVSGIQEGRVVFSNAIKYIKSTLTANVGNFFAIAIASLLIDYLPMLPLQLLLLNLLSDFPMIAVATDSVDPGELASPKSYQIRDIALVAMVLGVVSTVFDFIFFGIFSPSGPGALRTNWFIGSILTELIMVFSIRTKKFMFFAQRPSWTLIWLSLVAAAVTLALPYSAIGVNLFGFARPTTQQIMISLGLVAAYLITNETVKLLYYRAIDRTATLNKEPGR